MALVAIRSNVRSLEEIRRSFSDIDRNFRTAPLNNLDATTDPSDELGTGTDDISKGYQVGSIWVNTTTNEAWICVQHERNYAQWQPLAGTPLGGAPYAFKTILNDGETVVAETNDDTLTITGSTGVTVSGTEATDSLVISVLHNSLPDLVPQEHVNHASVVMTAGAGMTGGGDISVSRTFDVIGTASEIAVSAGAVGLADNAILPGNQAVTVPSGTTAQRGTPTNGMFRYNSENNVFEAYENSAWIGIGGNVRAAANLDPDEIVVGNGTVNAKTIGCTLISTGGTTKYAVATGENLEFNGSQDGSDLTCTLSNSGTGNINLVVQGEITVDGLGANLDVNGFKLVSASNGDIDIEPNGTGNVLLGNFTFDADQTIGPGQDNYVLTYDYATGLISLEAASGGGGAPTDAWYLTLAADATLSQERVFTAGNGLAGTDGGAGSTYTLDIDLATNPGLEFSTAKLKVLLNGSSLALGASGLSISSPIDETIGGTGQTSITAGDILYGSAANVLSKLAVSTSAGYTLQSSGTLPQWAAPTVAPISPHSISWKDTSGAVFMGFFGSTANTFLKEYGVWMNSVSSPREIALRFHLPNVLPGSGLTPKLKATCLNDTASKTLEYDVYTAVGGDGDIIATATATHETSGGRTTHVWGVSDANKYKISKTTLGVTLTAGEILAVRILTNAASSSSLDVLSNFALIWE